MKNGKNKSTYNSRKRRGLFSSAKNLVSVDMMLFFVDVGKIPKVCFIFPTYETGSRKNFGCAQLTT